MSEKIENRNKEEKLTWGSPPVQPSSSRPAQPAGGPARLLLCRLRPRQREGSVPGARARHRATPPASLLAWRPPRRPGTPDDATQPPRPLSHSPSPSFSPPALSLSPKALPPPQLTTDALPAVPSPLRRVPELRRDPLSLLTEQATRTSSASSQSPSSSSFGRRDRRRRSGCPNPSPSPLRRPLQPR